MISFLLSSWSYNLINLVFIDRFLFIDRFNQFSWESRYSRNSRIKLFSNRERFAKSYSTYSISSALTSTFFTPVIFVLFRFFFVFHLVIIRLDDVIFRDIRRFDFLLLERFKWFVFDDIFFFSKIVSSSFSRFVCVSLFSSSSLSLFSSSSNNEWSTRFDRIIKFSSKRKKSVDIS
jgi:hypothetical protein